MTKTGLGTSTSSESGHCSRRHVILAATAVLGWQLLNARQSPAYSQEMKMGHDAATGSTGSPFDQQALVDGPAPNGGDVVMTRDQLIARLKRAGELVVSGEDQAETDSYFDRDHATALSSGIVADFFGQPGMRRNCFDVAGHIAITRSRKTSRSSSLSRMACCFR